MFGGLTDGWNNNCRSQITPRYVCYGVLRFENKCPGQSDLEYLCIYVYPVRQANWDGIVRAMESEEAYLFLNQTQFA